MVTLPKSGTLSPHREMKTDASRNGLAHSDRRRVDPRVDHPRHVVGHPLDVRGVLALEQLIDGRMEMMEPALEARPIHRRLGGEAKMHAHGIAAKTAFIKEHGLPKGIKTRQMLVPIHLRNAVKDGSQHVIGPDFFVEAIYEKLDLGAALNVGGRVHTAKQEPNLLAFQRGEQNDDNSKPAPITSLPEFHPKKQPFDIGSDRLTV